MATVNTVQGTLNFCAAFILNRPPTGIAGTYQEPAITIANLLLSTILAPPFAWQWNRAVATVNLTQGTTDYTTSLPNFGWLEKATVAYVTPPTNGTASLKEIEISTMLTSDTGSGDQATPWKICISNDDNAGNITFRVLPSPDQAYTLTLTYQNAPVPVTSLFNTTSLGAITSIAAASGYLTTYTASGNFTGGNANGLAGKYLQVTGTTIPSGFRTSPNDGLYFCTASTSTTVTLQNQNGVVQAGAAGNVYTATTWAPVPDKYNFLYERGMLAHLHGMYDTASYLQELQLFFRQLVGCSEGLDDTAKAIFLNDRLEQLRTQAFIQNATSGTIKRGM